MAPSPSSGGAGFALAQDHLEAFELGMAEVEAFAGLVVGAGVGPSELLRFGPGFECRLVDPDRMRGIQRVILGDGSLEQMKLDEAGHAAEIGFAGAPDGLEGRFRANLHLEPVHCDKHSKSPCWVAPGVRFELVGNMDAPKPRWSISAARCNFIGLSARRTTLRQSESSSRPCRPCPVRGSTTTRRSAWCRRSNCRGWRKAGNTGSTDCRSTPRRRCPWSRSRSGTD